jgi:hypothetical protein
MSNPTVQRILDQAAALDAIRATQEGIWDDLAQICFPRRGPVSHARNPQTGGQADRRRVAENFDGTAMRACNILATGQAARITPMGARWFVLRPPAALAGNSAAEAWYGRCTEILAAKLGVSNFYNRAFECYQDRGGFGVSAMETTAGANGRGLHFRVLPVGTFSVAENSLDEVDTIFRSAYRTPAQLAGQFGLENLPAPIRQKFDDPASRHVNSERVIHAVFPRQDRDPRKLDGPNKPIASIHVHPESDSVLLESGFDSVPVAVSRWQTNALCPYGWAPADYALPEAAQANFQEQMLDVLAETAAFPRILYPAGMKDEIDFAAMGLTSFDPNAGETAIPREWLTAGRYDIGKDRAMDKKKAIEDAFFVDLFKAISQLPPTATATQVSAIVSESRELFHPIYSNMVREFHTPVLRRAFALLLEQGEMPPPPAAVIGQDDLGAFIADPEVEYVSAMALALEQTHLAGLGEILAVLTPLAQLDPAWLAALNPDAIAPHLIRAKGLPESFLRSEREMAAIRAAQAEQAQAAQAMAATEGVRNLGGVDEAAKAASYLSQTP